MADPCKEFEQALLVGRVASRFAMEHDSPAAMKKYLQEHPDADRSNHSVKKAPKGGQKRPAMKGKSVGPNKPIADWKPADYEQFLKEFTYKDVRPMGEIFKNKADIEAIENGMPKKLRKNFDYYKGVREKRWNELKDSDEAKALQSKDEPKSDPEPKDKPAKSESKSKFKEKDKDRDDLFGPGGKFDSDKKPSTKEYIEAVEGSLTSKHHWGWKDPAKVKDFMSKYNKLDREAQGELAWRLIEEGTTPERLAESYF